MNRPKGRSGRQVTEGRRGRCRGPTWCDIAVKVGVPGLKLEIRCRPKLTTLRAKGVHGSELDRKDTLGPCALKSSDYQPPQKATKARGQMGALGKGRKTSKE